MYFNVSNLLRGTVGESQPFHFADEELRYDGADFTDITARGRLTRTDRTVLAEATVQAASIIECSRCLAQSEVQVTVEFAEEYVPENADLMARRGRAGVSEDDEALWIDDSNTLDLSVALWQTLRSGLPMVQLCRPDCLGICTECYVDRNSQDCECDMIGKVERNAGTTAVILRIPSRLDT